MIQKVCPKCKYPLEMQSAGQYRCENCKTTYIMEKPEEKKEEGNSTLYFFNLFGEPYNMALISDRKKMRIVLVIMGFFKIEENKKYFDMFEKVNIGHDNVFELLNAIKLFSSTKIPRGLKEKN